MSAAKLNAIAVSKEVPENVSFDNTAPLVPVKGPKDFKGDIYQGI